MTGQPRRTGTSPARPARMARGWRTPRGLLPVRRLSVALAVALVPVTAAGGWLGWQVHGQQAQEQRRQDILAAARQAALNFTSLDYRHYERDSRNVLGGSTGAFKEQFASQTKQLTQLVRQNRSVSKGQVLEAGITRSDERSARVLVVADSKVTNVSVPKGQARNYRLQLDLVYEDGRWLTSNVEFVG